MILERNDKKVRLNIEYKLLIPSLIVSVIGLIALLSTTIQANGTFGDTSIVLKQLIFIIVGYIFFALISLIDLSFIKYWQIVLPIYVVTILLLVSVILFGPYINNVRRWLVIGGIQIQPSEFAKITVILVTAFVLSLKDRYNQWILFLISFLLVIPVFLLIFSEPDGSMSILILAIWFFVAFTGLDSQFRNSMVLLIMALNILAFLLTSILTTPIWYALIAVSVVVSIFAFFYKESWRSILIIGFVLSILLGISSTFVWQNVLKEYQKERIEVFLNPTENTNDQAFNVNQARIAIGSGQIIGKGFGNGTQSKRRFLPEFQTDFIFASFAEEFGLVGSIFLILMYCVIISVGIYTAVNVSYDPFLAMIAIGITTKLLLEVFINIGTNTGVIPATGIPLPLVSAGGSITLVTLFSFGLIQSIIGHSTKVDNTTNIIQDFDD